MNKGTANEGEKTGKPSYERGNVVCVLPQFGYGVVLGYDSTERIVRFTCSVHTKGEKLRYEPMQLSEDCEMTIKRMKDTIEEPSDNDDTLFDQYQDFMEERSLPA